MELICHGCGFRQAAKREDRLCPHDARPLIALDQHQTHPDDPLLGTVVLGKYRILARLGQGGYGAVYRGWQPEIDRPVAIKLLTAVDLTSEARVEQERFRREAALLARLDHPNIVRLYDYQAACPPLPPCMVLELVPGITLGRALLRQTLTQRQFLRLVEQVLAALACAHHQRVIHRDLKPANIMIAPTAGVEPQVKVLDFGIAKLLEPEAERMHLTRTGLAPLTPAYAAPEQGYQPVDARSDLYSLGVILFEGLAGYPPFGPFTTQERQNPSVIFTRRIHYSPVRLPPEVAPALRAVIRQALAPLAEQRFQTAPEMAAALLRIELGAEGDRLLPVPRDDVSFTPEWISRDYEPELQQLVERMRVLLLERPAAPRAESPPPAEVPADVPAEVPAEAAAGSPSVRPRSGTFGGLSQQLRFPSRGWWIGLLVGLGSLLALGLGWWALRSSGPLPGSEATEVGPRPLASDPAAPHLDPVSAVRAGPDAGAPDTGTPSPLAVEPRPPTVARPRPAAATAGAAGPSIPVRHPPATAPGSTLSRPSAPLVQPTPTPPPATPASPGSASTVRIPIP